MNRFSVKAMLIGLLALSSFFLSVSPAFANCDGWAEEGSSHRNAGNGCSYTCRNGAWAGPNQCDGSGNGQFQGEAARTAEERERQARAVAERNAEARAQVERQGTAETARIAASTAQQREIEATRQQAMVENQRQQEVAIATRFGASAQEIAAINARAREAATFVSQAQGTDRGANLVGSDSQQAADIAARGYDANSELATGVTVVNSSSNASVGGGGGGDVAAAALYTGPGQCNILAETNGDVVPGGKCCRGGNVECASGTCSAGNIGQEGVCTGGTVADNVGPSTTGTLTSVSFRDSTGRATILPVVESSSGCTTAPNTKACSYQGRFVCVNASTYAGESGCSNWTRDFTAQANRGSAETILQTPNTCTGNTRGCMYGGGWVCVDRTRYPETNSPSDPSNGCAAWQREYTRTQSGGTMTHKINSNGSCVTCAPNDGADVCKYSSFIQCSNAQALDTRAASRPLYRLLSGVGTSCIRCVTAQDVERYNCAFTESTCGGQSAATITVDPGQRCNATPGVKCFCSSLNRAIDRDVTCPTEAEGAAIRNLPACNGANDPITTKSGANRIQCLRNNVVVYKCTRGTAADSCGTATSSQSTGTGTVSPTGGNTTVGNQNDDFLTVTDRATEVSTNETVSPRVTYVAPNGFTHIVPVRTSPNCTEGWRGCQYNGGWVCVPESFYPEVSASQDSSRGCAAWDEDRREAANSGTVSPTTSQDSSRVSSCNMQVCNSSTCTGLTSTEQERLNSCISSANGTAPVIRNGTCSQGHSQRIPSTDNLYCCNGNIVNRACLSPVDANRAGENLANGTWCNTGWWATNTCAKCANGYHRENGRDYCGPSAESAADQSSTSNFCANQSDNTLDTSGTAAGGRVRMKCCGGVSVTETTSCNGVIGIPSENAVSLTQVERDAANTVCANGTVLNNQNITISRRDTGLKCCNRAAIPQADACDTTSPAALNAEAKVAADGRSHCGGDRQAVCDVSVTGGTTVQSCDTGNLLNANINRCVPALYSNVPSCTGGKLYVDQNELTNLTACYSGSITGRQMLYFCPSGTSCTEPGQTIGVNGCSLQSARANAVSCGFTSSGTEIFRCEHGPGRQPSGGGDFVCPDTINGELVYYFPSTNQSVTQPPSGNIFCQNRANGTYTDNGYSYNCCNTLNIPRGQQCIAVQSNNQTLLCPETGCTGIPQVARASDAVITNPNQRWACSMATSGTFTQTQTPSVCRACDGTSPVMQVSCSSLPNSPLPLQQFDNASAIYATYPNANPEFRE